MGNSKAAVEPEARRKKKKGRPSLLDLEKRSLRLQKLQDEQENKKHHRDHNPSPPNPNSRILPSSSARRSSRRHPVPASEDDGGGGGGRREKKKLRLVPHPPHREAGNSSDSGESGGRCERKANAVGDRGKGEWPNSASKATDGLQEPSDSGPTTPLPDKKLLVFILDRLQKKDTYGVFSEPVDPEELPDYHDIIKHPMDFGTIMKKLDDGAYANLEQFENDVFLLSSNAMCYNAPDTIYYRQGRAIQELAKKDFENLRQESDSSEPETKPRRGRPPLKNTFKQKASKHPADRANLDYSEAMLGNVGNSSGHDFSRNGLDKLRTSDVPGVYYGLRNKNSWSPMHKSESNEGSGTKGLPVKFGKKLLSIDESRRSTYNQPYMSASIEELAAITAFNAERKLLVPVGFHLQHSYSHSLARFAAKLGPVGWEIAAKRIERVLPPGTKFGHGWAGDSEAPQHLQPPPVLAASPLHPSAQPKITAESPSNGVASEGCDSSSFALRALPSSASGSAELGIGSKQLFDRGSDDRGDQPKASQLQEIPASQSTMNGFISESARTDANMAFRNIRGHIFRAHDNQMDAQKAKLAGDLRAPQSSSDNNQERQVLRFAGHPKPGSVPSDLDIGFRSRAAPPASSLLADAQQPDLALQL